MKNARELLDEINATDEHVRIEAKRGSEFGKSAMETICAFANEPGLGGGYLLLGVSIVEDSFWPLYQVEGISKPDKIQAEIATQCATMLNVVIRPQISVEQIYEKNVLVVYVPEASPHEKPVHFKNKPLPESAWRRIGSTDQQCTDDDLVLFYQSRKSESFDEQVVTDAKMSDIDLDVVKLYRTMRQDIDATAEELNWADENLLESLKAVKLTDKGLQPTVAGILLFGTTMSLRRLFPMTRIDYIRVVGTEWIPDPDRRFDTIEIRVPLIRAINRARATVLDDIPKAFSLPTGESQSKEVPTLPDRVIREVIANAVMHRDYRSHSAIMLIRYSNRLEIRNPGYSLKSPERLGEPGSDTRNPTIAAVLHDLKLAETKGSGIRVMREEMERRGLSPPLLDSDRTGNSFMAMLLFHHFLGDDDILWLSSLGYDLTNEERRAMIQAREVGAIDNSTYRDLNKNSDTLDASRHLRRLCDVGLLQKKGKGVKTYYQPTTSALENWPPERVRPEFPQLSMVAKSPELAVKSLELTAKSLELEAKSLELEAKSSELNHMPHELREKLNRLGRKSPKDTITDLIYELLLWKAMSLAQIAEEVGRTTDHIRTYLKELLQADLVRPTQQSITDPNQTYRATKMLHKK